MNVIEIAGYTILFWTLLALLVVLLYVLIKILYIEAQEGDRIAALFIVFIIAVMSGISLIVIGQVL